MNLDKQMISVKLSQLTFNGGQTLSMNPSDIVILVGPNNSGKSSSLSALRALLSGAPEIQSPLSEISVEKISKFSDITAALAPYLQSTGRYMFGEFSLPANQVQHFWENNGPNCIGELAKLAVSELTTRTRLSDCDPQQQFEASRRGSANHPFHHMYIDDTVELAVSRAFRTAFKTDFLIHRQAGGTIPAYVGERPDVSKGEDRQSRSYIDKLESLDPLATQGDGMRSFASIVGRVLTESKPILLIDEPEAFLHPPQARLIGSLIAAQSADRQTLIATHSTEVLKGILSGGQNRVSVVRLSRKDQKGRADFLDNDKIKELWQSPILQFSNILDGLFHDAVVITESDADCRFYEAIVSASTESKRLPDVHFTYSGGKDRIAVVANALKALEVPVASIVDFDVLNDEQPLRKIVEAHGGIWSSLEKDWHTVKAAVERTGTFLGAKQFTSDILSELKRIGNQETVPKAVLSAIKKLSRNASPWDSAKDSGLQAVPKGEPTKAANRLLSALKELGVFVTPLGEMEGFCRTIETHGPRWVESVLQKDLVNDTDLAEARKFANELVGYLVAK